MRLDQIKTIQLIFQTKDFKPDQISLLIEADWNKAIKLIEEGKTKNLDDFLNKLRSFDARVEIEIPKQRYFKNKFPEIVFNDWVLESEREINRAKILFQQVKYHTHLDRIDIDKFRSLLDAILLMRQYAVRKQLDVDEILKVYEMFIDKTENLEFAPWSNVS